MKRMYSRLMSKVIPAFVTGVLFTMPVYAAEETTEKNKQASDVPPPPGPYRSMQGSDRSESMPRQQREQMQQQRFQPIPQADGRQWTPQTPPQWAQQNRRPPQRPNWANNQQPPQWVQEQRRQMNKPYVPPKWVQEQRKKSAQNSEQVKSNQPPKWVEEQRKQMAGSYEQPNWVQEQRAQAEKNRQRYQECGQPHQVNQQRAFQGRQWTPPAPPQWRQYRAAPPQYAYRGYQRPPMPHWGNSGYPQYRR